MTPQPSEIARVASTVAGRTHDGFALVAIDGPGGSGKTTFATALAEALGVAGRTTVVHGDDFYRPAASEERLRLTPEDGYHRYFDWQRLRDQVLIPITSGTAAVYRCYDWSTGALAEEETRVSRSGTVIVEGVFAARPELAGHYDLTVYVDTPRETCLRRQYARGDDHGPGDWIDRRRAAEEHYLAATQPATRADLTVRGF